MELPYDVVREIGKYTQPSARGALSVTAKNILKKDLENEVHAYNLANLIGMDLFEYIYENSLDDEFERRDWYFLVAPESLKLLSKDRNSMRSYYYPTDAQLRIMKIFLAKYDDYLLFCDQDVFYFIGLHDLLPENRVKTHPYLYNYYQGVIYRDDDRAINAMRSITQIEGLVNAENHVKAHSSYSLMKKIGMEVTKEKDAVHIIENMYYHHSKKPLLTELLSKATTMKISLDSLEDKPDEMIKMVCDDQLNKKLLTPEEVSAYFLDLYVNDFQILNDLKAYYFIHRIKTIEIYEKCHRLVNFNIDEIFDHYLGTITSATVYNYILERKKPSIELLLSRLGNGYDIVIKNYIDDHFERVEDVMVDLEYPHLYNLSLELNKSHGIKFNYEFSLNLVKALNDYDGTKDSLLHVLNMYGDSIVERHHFFYLKVEIPVKFFEQALKLVDHNEILEEYNGLLYEEVKFQIYPCYNFFQAYINLYGKSKEIIDMIIDFELVGLLEQLDLDQDDLEYISSYTADPELRDSTSDYDLVYLSNLYLMKLD